MSVISVVPPFSTFPDVDGDPLESGYIYIGVAGLNPITNPVAVFADQALTVPVAQPVRTIGGHPVLAGSPTRLYVGSSDYSILVRNKNSTLVYSSLTNVQSVGLVNAADLQYGVTPEETAGGVTPSDYQYWPTPVADARRYGWSAANSEAQNAAAITRAISALTSLGGGGIVQLPAGTFNCDSFTIPAYVHVKGAGDRATVLQNGDAGYFVKVGGDKTGTLKYKCGISDVAILLGHKDGHAIRLMETVGALVENIYSEGQIVAARTNTFLTIDGGDASNFFNQVRNCLANHYQEGYLITTTGSVLATCTTFENCTSLGDVGGGYQSNGLRLAGNCGNGSIWKGGNFESCFRGMYFDAAGSMTFYGVRLEGNTTDIEFDALGNPQSFFGLVNLDPAKIIDNSGTGYDLQNYYGCKDVTGRNFGDRIVGQANFRSSGVAEIALTVQAYPTQTTVLFRVVNSANTQLFGVYAGTGDVQSEGWMRVAGNAVGLANYLTIGKLTQTTVGAAGGATALPATPLGYFRWFNGATEVAIPYYNRV